jgi:ABC-type multidrug transport system ATPase subunit
MQIVFDKLCSHDGIQNLDLSIDLSRVSTLYDPQENLSRAILYALVGLDHIVSGSITIDGIPLERYSAQEPLIKSFAYIFDEGIMLANLTLRENLMLPLRWINPNLKEVDADELIHSWLQTFNLDLDLSERPAAYRAGPLKLLSFIRALLLAPKALIMDDPFYLLNKIERQNLFSVLSRLRNSYPMLIASTDDEFGEGFADTVIDLSPISGLFAP